MTDSEANIKRAFLDGDIEALEAISRLEELGYASRRAEEMVNEWDVDGPEAA